jgi:prepilin-type processing-associated H-X9-DG protein
MRYVAITCFALCLALISGAAPQAKDIPTPEATLRAFMDSLCAGDFNKAVSYVENAKPDASFDSMGQEMKNNQVSYTMSDAQTLINGDQATVKVSGELTSPIQNPLKFNSVVKLHKGDGGWHIVPDGAAWEANQGDIINGFSCVLTNPQLLAKSRDMARMVSCMSNMKQLALGVLDLVQNHGEKYALKAESYKKAILPCVKYEQLFNCPSDPPGPASYAFNPHIAGVALGRITNPAITVILYESKEGKLNFRHDGKAGVAFADGHAAMVTEAESKTLRWKP